MDIQSVKRTSIAIAGLIAVAVAGAQPVTTGLIATDAGHDRIIEFTLPPSELGILWEGAPLNEPTGMIQWDSAVPEPEYWVCNAGDGSVVAFDWTFNSYRTIVKAGQSTMVSPADLGVHNTTPGALYLLDSHDGAVHRFELSTGRFIDVLVPPLAPASSMLVTYSAYPQSKPVVIVAYPSLEKVIRYDAATGAIMNTVIEMEGLAFIDEGWSRDFFVFQDFADPNADDILHLITQTGSNVRAPRNISRGTAPNDYLSGRAHLGEFLVYDDRLLNVKTGASRSLPVGSRIDNLHETMRCYADCDAGGHSFVLDIFDFLCFQDSFVNGEAYACDCDTSTGSGVCDIFDFLCYQYAFTMGCP